MNSQLNNSNNQPNNSNNQLNNPVNTNCKFTKVESNSPFRCQAIIPQGQCQYQQVEGSLFCPMHGGPPASKHIEATKIRNYRFQRYEARINEFADSSGVKSLREEIGVLRMLLEETVNRCKTDNDLLIYSSKIANIVIQIEKLVVSCHRLESNLGFMMDKSTALNMATQIVNIISLHVKDETIITSVIDEITVLMEKS